MSLWRKVRVLVGALARTPFMPKPEKVDLDDGPDASRVESPRRDSSELEAGEPEIADTDRVADLIAQQQREGSKADQT
jgi:hypothetical protein